MVIVNHGKQGENKSVLMIIMKMQHNKEMIVTSMKMLFSVYYGVRSEDNKDKLTNRQPGCVLP